MAFPWICQANSDDRDVAIAHCRNEDEWEIFTYPYFLEKKLTEIISCQGLQREADELGQYIELGESHGRGERER